MMAELAWTPTETIAALALLFLVFILAAISRRASKVRLALHYDSENETTLSGIQEESEAEEDLVGFSGYRWIAYLSGSIAGLLVLLLVAAFPVKILPFLYDLDDGPYSIRYYPWPVDPLFVFPYPPKPIDRELDDNLEDEPSGP